MTQIIKIKRTLTPNGEPTVLAEGELAVNIVDYPIKMWIGTPSGPEQLLGEQVEDAPSDAIYGRSDGEWIRVILAAATSPGSATPGQFWFNNNNNHLSIRVGSEWQEIRGPVFIGDTAPPAPRTIGQLWYQPATEGAYHGLNVWRGTTWTHVGMENSPTGVAGAIWGRGQAGGWVNLNAMFVPSQVGSNMNGVYSILGGLNIRPSTFGDGNLTFQNALPDFPNPGTLVLARNATTGLEAVPLQQMNAAISAISLTPGPQGDPGIPGQPGQPGQAATIAVGDVETVEPDEQAEVENVGTSSAAIFDFKIPRGEQGEKGDTGETGAASTVPGPQGNPGAAATIAVGQVSTVDPEEAAEVENVGTSAAAIFDFKIPRGVQGEKGDTGDAGADSTVPGPQGNPGPQGDPGPPTFINLTQPSDPQNGELWWDQTNNVAKMWSGSAWQNLPGYLPLTGGTLTGNLNVPVLAASSGVNAPIITATTYFQTTGGYYRLMSSAGFGRWDIRGDDNQFNITRYSASGGIVDQPLTISFPTGAVSIANDLSVGGYVTLSGNAASALQPVPLQQLNSRLGDYLPLTGGTLTGPLTFADSGNPITLSNDDGYLIVDGSGTAELWALQRAWFDGGISVERYLFAANAGVVFDLSSSTRPGEFILGNLRMTEPQTSESNFSERVWNDSGWLRIGPATREYLPLTGGTLSGVLTLAQDATQPTEAVTLRQLQDLAVEEAPLDNVAYVRSNAAWQALPVVPECGILRYVSATELSFRPFRGNTIRINGRFYTIPEAGIAGLFNTNVFVEGLPGRNLAALTLYRVYCFNNSDILTAEFSTIGHESSTRPDNYGTEIKLGNETRTLIGIVQIGSDGAFYDVPEFRYTRSWFNRGRMPIQRQITVSYSNTTAAETSAAATFVSFAEPLFGTAHFYGTSTVSTNNFFTVRFNGAPAGAMATSSPHTTAGFEGASMSGTWITTEGFHRLALWAHIQAPGTTSGQGGVSGILG